MGRLTRLFKHRLWDERDVRRALGDGALARLQARVAASEAGHSGEIRVCVEGGLPLGDLWRGLQVRERAVTMFGQLRVWDTEANNGVLIYLLMAERAIEIVADRGLARRVPESEWQVLLQGMREAFRAGRFEAGLLQAVEVVDRQLRAHFPLAAGERDVNELPDVVDLR